MLNKKNIIISGLASIMLTYSFNYIAIAGLDGKINMKKANNNANLSINKSSHYGDSVHKGLAVHKHTYILKNINIIRSHLSATLANKKFIGDSLKIDPALADKRRKVNELNESLTDKKKSEATSIGFAPHKARLVRLYKDHNSKSLAADAKFTVDQTAHEQNVTNHKAQMKSENEKLDLQIADININIKAIDAGQKAMLITPEIDAVNKFFDANVAKHYIVSTNFDKLTVGAMSRTLATMSVS